MWPPIRLAKAAVEHVLDLTRLFLPRFLRAIKIPVITGIFSIRALCLPQSPWQLCRVNTMPRHDTSIQRYAF